MLLMESVGYLERKLRAGFMQVEVADSTTVVRTRDDEIIASAA